MCMARGRECLRKPGHLPLSYLTCTARDFESKRNSVAIVESSMSRISFSSDPKRGLETSQTSFLSGCAVCSPPRKAGGRFLPPTH